MKKVPSMIWYDGCKFKVIKHYKPTKFDDYLLCIRKDENNIHEDGKTEPMEMILLDCYNDEFYPSSKRIDKIVKDLAKLKQEYHHKTYDMIETLRDSWLDLVRC